MLIDFRQFLYDSVKKVLFKADYYLFFIFFFWHDRNAKAKTSTQSEHTAYIYAHVHNAIVQCITN